MHHGVCVGGPYDGKKIAHLGAILCVALEPHHYDLYRAIPGMVAATSPVIKFGEYHFGDGLWTWQDPTADAA